MNVRMYDCKFGDCFRLRNVVENDLYVDFGIHNSCRIGIATIKHTYDKIIADMSDHTDFVLTHYHGDHFDGAIYMANKTNKKFDNVYLPDIWKINRSIDVVLLSLIRGLLAKFTLKKGLTIMRFLISIAKTAGKIHFVKRGSAIQKKYITLWPEEEFMNEKAKKKCENFFPQTDEELPIRIIARRLIKVVLNLQDSRLDDRVEIIEELETLDYEYLQLQNSYPSDSNDLYNLSVFGNSISIVFQNRDKNDKNVLFTGDVQGKRIWNKIEKNVDKKIDMHDRYQVIKVPHHGTNSCYHSFVKYANENTYYLIPNGVAPQKNWSITKKYSDDINSGKSTGVCADNKACDGCVKLICACKKHMFASFIGYYDI